MKPARLLVLIPLVAILGCAEHTKSERFMDLFSEVCVATNADVVAIDQIAQRDNWRSDPVEEPISEGQRVWTIQREPLGEVRISAWTGEVLEQPHHLCMIVALQDAQILASRARIDLSLPEPIVQQEDDQAVRYWFFEREGMRNYLEVRQAGDGNGSIALGVPIM